MNEVILNVTRRLRAKGTDPVGTLYEVLAPCVVRNHVTGEARNLAAGTLVFLAQKVSYGRSWYRYVTIGAPPDPSTTRAALFLISKHQLRKLAGLPTGQKNFMVLDKPPELGGIFSTLCRVEIRKTETQGASQ